MSNNKSPQTAAPRGKSGSYNKTAVTSKQTRNESVNKYEGGGIPPGASRVGKQISGSVLFAGAVFMLALANVGLVVNALIPKTYIIAATEDGKLIRPVPLPQAFVTESRVLGFVDECLRASFSHDFENYRRTFN